MGWKMAFQVFFDLTDLPICLFVCSFNDVVIGQ